MRKLFLFVLVLVTGFLTSCNMIIIYYKITIPDGVTVNVDDLNKVREGTEVEFTVTIPEGATLEFFKINEKTVVLSDNKYSLVVKENIIVEVKFTNLTDNGNGEDEDVYYSLTLPEEITSNVENDLKVLANFTVILTIHIPVDMEVDEFKINGQIVNLEGYSYTFKIVENTTITVTFKEIEEEKVYYSLTLPEEITSNAENNLKVLADSTVSLTISIPQDKEVDEFKINGQIVNLEGDSYTFKIAEDTTITVTFKETANEIVEMGAEEINYLLNNSNPEVFKEHRFINLEYTKAFLTYKLKTSFDSNLILGETLITSGDKTFYYSDGKVYVDNLIYNTTLSKPGTEILDIFYLPYGFPMIGYSSFDEIFADLFNKYQEKITVLNEEALNATFTKDNKQQYFDVKLEEKELNHIILTFIEYGILNSGDLFGNTFEGTVSFVFVNDEIISLNFNLLNLNNKTNFLDFKIEILEDLEIEKPDVDSYIVDTDNRYLKLYDQEKLLFEVPIVLQNITENNQQNIIEAIKQLIYIQGYQIEDFYLDSNLDELLIPSELLFEDKELYIKKAPLKQIEEVLDLTDDFIIKSFIGNYFVNENYYGSYSQYFASYFVDKDSGNIYNISGETVYYLEQPYYKISNMSLRFQELINEKPSFVFKNKLYFDDMIVNLVKGTIEVFDANPYYIYGTEYMFLKGEEKEIEQEKINSLISQIEAGPVVTNEITYIYLRDEYKYYDFNKLEEIELAIHTISNKTIYVNLKEIDLAGEVTVVLPNTENDPLIINDSSLVVKFYDSSRGKAFMFDNEVYYIDELTDFPPYEKFQFFTMYCLHNKYYEPFLTFEELQNGLTEDFTELYLLSVETTFEEIIENLKILGYGLKVSQTRLPKISAEYDFTTNTFISDDYSVIFNDNIIITIDGELYTFSYEEFMTIDETLNVSLEEKLELLYLVYLAFSEKAELINEEGRYLFTYEDLEFVIVHGYNYLRIGDLEIRINID